MKRPWMAIVLIALTGGGLAACKAKPLQIAPEVAASDEALFKAGESFAKKDREKARLYFRQVMDSFPKSFYAQRAKLAIADSYFAEGDEGNMILAAAEYRDFISQYPYSPSAPYAQYRIAMCFYTKVLKPGRDPQKTVQALTEFRKLLAAYPKSEEADQAQAKIKDCEERLAAHYATIGAFYYRSKAYRAATTRLREIVTLYPTYSKMDEVYFYLGDSYALWKKPDEARPFLTKVTVDYPKSKFAPKAAKRLAEIETEKAKPAPPDKAKK